jgi:phosphohistidine phosphatase
MILYVIRHGDAEKENPGGDSARKLTEKGKKRSQQMGKFLKKKIEPQMLVSSPYVRAVQTAEQFVDQFKLKKKAFMKSEVLVPGSELKDIIQELNSLGAEQVAVVGHNPLLSDLCCTLIGKECEGIDLKKTAVAKITFEGKLKEGDGTLEWLVTPGVIS